MTVIEAIQRHAEFLASRGVVSPRLQVELLLSHILRLPRMKLFLETGRALKEGEVRMLGELVARRGERIPLQHLVGNGSFGGIELEVNRDVLVPRPETEVLAELAIARLKKIPQDAPVALDFGTGSGCLAIALALAEPKALIHAVDCSPVALDVARRNARCHGVDSRIWFHLGDGFAALPADMPPVDLLVSNPPYIPTAEIATLDPEVREHDPRAALDGGVDGLDFYRRIAEQAPKFLRAGAPALLEFGDGQEDFLPGLFIAPAWRFESIEKDLGGRPRIVIACRAGCS